MRGDVLFALTIGLFFLFTIEGFAGGGPIQLTRSQFLERFTPPISSEMQSALIEANENFTYKGSPVKPELVKEFAGWISDGGPITLAVDVSHAYGSDEYYEKTEERETPTGLFYCVVTDIGDDTKNRFCYTHRHATKDGDHYLEAFTNDFTEDRIYQTFEYNFTVRFDIWHGVDSEGDIYEQLVMRVIGYK